MISTAEAAKRLGVSQRRVGQLIRSGGLQAEKVSGVWLVDEKSVRVRSQTVSKRGGRPAKGKGKDEVSFVLMNRTHEIAHVAYHRKRREFTLVGDLADAARAPIGIARAGTIALDDFNRWWRGRGIPATRDNLVRVLEEAGARVPEELLYRNLGLSLSDQYWICPAGSGLQWEDVNFFNNGFELVSQRTAFSQDVKGMQDMPRANPDNTSDGNLAKHWIERGKRRILQKGGRHNVQEPYNEVVATALHKRMLKKGNYVPYTLGQLDGDVVCECPNFLKDDEEYVPAYYVDMLQEERLSSNSYQHYVSCCEELGVQGIERSLAQMIVCDDVIANHDRHWRNFGIVRNVDTLECRPAPLFDSGASLWCDFSMDALKASDGAYACKPFEDRPSYQLMLVQDLGWADYRALDGFVDEALAILEQDEWIVSRLPHVRRLLEHRVARMQHILEWG